MRLVIDPDTQAKIDAVVLHAEAHPLDLTMLDEDDPMPVVGLEDEADVEKFAVEIPPGILVTFHLETQPAGVFRHISVSIPLPRQVPSLALMSALLPLFGFTGLDLMVKDVAELRGKLDACWVDEIDGETRIVNIVQRIERTGTH